MNKYQEALIDIRCDTHNFIENNYDEAFKMLYNKQFKLLQELVDKATPKKPIRFKNSVYISNPKCPICKTIPHTGNQKYCDECGQALDWSDEEMEVEDE